ncbi:MAG TPA: nodulation protein NfeD [Candidatus Omnitrophica bacterium]|nr:nodulation protein NfeD [Candidatus Omnitrophota bacterium]
MAPSTNIGAAHPVQMGKQQKGLSDLVKELLEAFKKEGEEKSDEKDEKPDEPAEDIMSQKIISDTVAWISAIAKTRGRNVEWAKRSVVESVSITEQEALQENIIDFTAGDLDSLLEQIDKREVRLNDKIVILNTAGAQIVKVEMTRRQRFLNIVTNPTIAYILMILGFYGLLFEFTHPGIGFPGIAGFISIILGFYGLHTLPTNYAGLALIILGIILFIAEMQVESFGLLTLGGVVSMVLGSVILIDSPYSFMRISLNVIIPIVLATAGISLFLATAVIKTHRRKTTLGAEGLIGKTAEVIEDLDPQGKVFVHGEIWRAITDEGIIPRGRKVKILKVKDMALLVEEVVN